MLIHKKTLDYLAELSRIELKEKSEEKLLKDLEKILEHFEELKEIDTENIEPMAGGLRLAEGSLRPAEGGTMENNVLREDESNNGQKITSGKLSGAFPEEENGYLKVPPVFAP